MFVSSSLSRNSSTPCVADDPIGAPLRTSKSSSPRSMLGESQHGSPLDGDSDKNQKGCDDFIVNDVGKGKNRMLRRLRKRKKREYDLMDNGVDEEKVTVPPQDIAFENMDTKDDTCSPLVLVPSSDTSSSQLDYELNIPEDSFSIFYVAKTAKDSTLPIVIFGLQMSMLSLIFFNLRQQTYESTLDLKINIPVDVAIEVKVAQYLACFVSVFTSADFVDGILYFRTRIICEEGNLSSSFHNIAPPRFKWELCNLLRMIEGAFVIAVSFIFIVQSTTVIDLFLNFAGVAFVSELDNVAFRLAKIGLLGIATQKNALLVLQHRAVGNDGQKFTYRTMTRRNIVRLISFAVITFGMWARLSFFVFQQSRLRYACKSVIVSVGELPASAGLRSFSGRYVLNHTNHAGRAVYVQEQGMKEEKNNYIAYCDTSQMWTVTDYAWAEKYGAPVREEAHCRDPWNPCCHFDLQSQRTRTFDITEISEFKHYSGRFLDNSIWCSECLEQEEGSCGFSGNCIENDQFAKSGEDEFKYTRRDCDCDSTHFGDSCQFEGPCTELGFQDDEFPGYGKSFNLLYYKNEPLMVHERPAYILRNPSSINDSAALLFDGGRWLVIKYHQFEDRNASKYGIEEYLAKHFNAMNTTFGYDYISELSNGGSPADVPFRASLSRDENAWTMARLGQDEFILNCADCHTKSLSEDLGEEDEGFDCQNSGFLGDDDKDDADDDHITHDTLCEATSSDVHPGSVNRCNCEKGFIGPLCGTRPIEGKLLLQMEHGETNACSVCGDTNIWTVHELIGLYGKTCLPFPREPLNFEGANGAPVSRQLGLNLNETHFSVFVSNRGRFFSKDKSADAIDLICSVQEGTNEIVSFKRSESKPLEQTHLDLAILLNKTKDFFGEVIDPGGIDCFTKSNINEHECDGSNNGTLSKVYTDHSLKKSDLMRVWIQFDLKVTI